MHPVELKRQEAFLAAGQHRLDQGLRAIRELLRRHPDHPLLQLDLAELTLQEPDTEAALRLARRALKRSEGPLVSRAAGIFHRAGRTTEALEILREGARHSQPLRLEWAMALERLNRLEEAEAAMREIPLSDPLALWLKGRLLRRNQRAEEAIDCLRALLASARGDARATSLAGYELAQALDETGDFPEAFKTLVRTKASITAGLPLATRSRLDAALEEEHEVRRRLCHGASLERLRRWRDEAPVQDGLPPLLVLTGHPRSGTTLLEQHLRRFPGVACVSEEQILRRSIERATHRVPREAGETPLDVLDRLETSVRKNARATYRAFLGKRAGAGTRVLLDKEPSYLDYLPVLLRFVPGMKLIVIRRDPRDVLLSSLFLPVPIDNPSAWAWLDPARAALRLRRVREAWDALRPNWPGSVMELDYETFLGDPDTCLSKLAGFMGVEAAAPEASPPAWISSPSYPRAAGVIDDRSVGRWQRYASELERAFGEVMSPSAA